MTNSKLETEEAPSTDLRRAVLFCNAHSRRGREWYPAARKKLTELGFELVRAENAQKPSRIRPMVEQAVKDKVPLIIIGGGDGTMSLCADAICRSSSTMGVLPLGTGNAFARDLGIPPDVDGACAVLKDGQAQQVDMGLAGDRHFVNVVTVGLTTRIAEELTDEAKRRFGRFVYVLALTRAISKIKPFRATITRPDGEETFETMQIVFGSGRFHAGPFPINTEAEITDHLLNGYALKGTSKGALVKLALKLLTGSHVNLPDVEPFSLTRATIATVPPKRVIIDGEAGPTTPIELAIDPGALRVMVPENFRGRTTFGL